jgi:hypothetical protein
MTHPTRCPYCGTISHGTLKVEDLIPVFAEALSIRLGEVKEEQRSRGRSVSGELRRAIDDLEQVELRMDEPDYYESEDADEDLQWLQEVLGYYAPPGHAFGAHPGDGSDFGFWPLDLFDGQEQEDEGAQDNSDGGRQEAAAARQSAGPTAFPAYEDTHAETWFERDRAHVALYDSRTHGLIAEWWDEDVAQAVEDGFLNPRDYHRSAYDYARQLAGAAE